MIGVQIARERAAMASAMGEPKVTAMVHVATLTPA